MAAPNSSMPAQHPAQPLLTSEELGPVARNAAERIVAACHPLQIVLFGSYARGRAHPGGDLDLLVVIPAGADRGDHWDRAGQGLRGLDFSHDVIVVAADELRQWGDVVGMVFRPALREGKLLYDAQRGYLDGDTPALSLIEVAPLSEAERLWTTRDWLAKAREDLQVAHLCLNGVPIAESAVCFHAQQAAEKALKAILVYLQIQYPFTYELNEVQRAIPSGWPVRGEFPDLESLSKWAIQSRYPGNWPTPTDDDAREALAQAQSIVDAVLRDLRAHGFELAS